MSSLDQLANRLSDFGITFNQARVYITAAQMGIASIKEISKKSNVPREEIYRLLPKLEKLGLLEKILGKPIKVKATPFGAVLSLLIKREKDMNSQRLSKLKAEKGKLLKDIQILEIKNDSEGKAHFTLISQRDAGLQKILSMIDVAERTIDMSISRDLFLHFFATYGLPIKKAISRGVEFRIVIEEIDHYDSIISLMKEYKSPRASFSIRFTNQRLCPYFIVDHKEALLSTSTELNPLRIEHYLWTTNTNLIDLILRIFEIIWLTSKEIETIKLEDSNKKLFRILDSLIPTDHLLLLYTTMEAKYNILSNFLGFGLKNGEAVVYVVSERNLEQTKVILERNGIDVEKYEKTGAIRILGDNEFYIINKNFCIETTRSLMEMIYEDALKRGFKGLRIFGEMDCFFQHNLIPQLIEYERSLNRIFDIPVIGMCAYDANLIEKASNSLDLYHELLKTHSNILYAGQDNKLGRLEIRQACTI